MKVRHDFSSSRSGKFKKSPFTNKHRVKFPKMVGDIIRTSDIILEVIDANYIEKTRNKEMEEVVLENGKKMIYILNKADLVDISELKTNCDLSDMKPSVLFSCKTKIGRAKLRNLIKIEVKKLKMGDKKARIGIIGYPNTGKSTLINVLVGKKGAGTSSDSGFTKTMKKIRFNKDILILDTPGVFQEKENPEINPEDLKKHAMIGIKKYDKVKNPDFIVADIMEKNPGKLEKFYGVDAKRDSEVLLEELGREKKFMKKKNEVDVERAARWVLKDWQEGKIK